MERAPIPTAPIDPETILNSLDTLEIDEQIEALENLLAALHRQLSGAQG
ncbi:MAG: hypothetical protein LKK54_00910 [Ancrocorticia sp.]|jgi:hypothetical protein|nr:hypothetical protein [Ancrocorticia sp.]MCI2192855.1 hypothetical protein [Ancrocorticia sp.]MCI2198290.1 hypothetical protein [Ancrocorticia sp.]